MSIDTLAFANRLKDAGVSPKQAEAHAEALAMVIDTNLATKQDIVELRKDLTHEIKDLESRTDVKFSDLKAEMVKWMIGMSAAQAAIIISVLKICH